MSRARLSIACLFALTGVASAAGPAPEITRKAAAPQAVGVAHTVRQIPEACVRIEGVFTGDAEVPYRYTVGRTGANCQPRATFADAATAQPSTAGGWIYSDLIRIPAQGCDTLQAVVKVWRKPVAQTAERDGQGRARLYLDEMKPQAGGAKPNAVPAYAASMDVEGTPCN